MLPLPQSLWLFLVGREQYATYLYLAEEIRDAGPRAEQILAEDLFCEGLGA